MSSRVTMALAVLLFLGALVAGYWGLVLSRDPVPAPPVAAPVVQSTPQPVVVAPPAPPIEDPTRTPVLVLARDIPAFVPLKADDFVIERLKVVPAGSFSKPEQAVGRSAWRPLAAGTWLSESNFESGGTLARMIRPGERALAVGIDEVIGAGGQLSPGDYVDVLLFLPEDVSNPDRSAQVVVSAVRVLSIGEELGPTLDGNAARNISDDERLKQEQRKPTARQAVLAVPEPLLSRLMLAAQSGTLRLAVRSADEKNLERYWASDSGGGNNDVAIQLDAAKRKLTHFSELSMSAPPRPQSTGTTVPRGPRPVEVIRGNQNSQQTAQQTP